MAAEWSLVAFTVTGQMAVGIYFFVGGPLILDGEISGGGGGSVRLTVVLVVLGFLAMATVLAFFHLHHPVRAYKIFSSLGTSWLSREIFFELLFMGLVGLLGFCDWRRVGGAGFINALFVLGGLAGVLFILTMSRLYMLPAVPAWNHLYTPLSFGLTSMALGAMASTAFFGLSAEPPPYYRPLLGVAFLSVVACLINAVLLAPLHGFFGARPEPSLRPPAGRTFSLHAARLSLLVTGALLLAAVLGARRWLVLKITARPVVLLAAFFLVTAAEVSGRFLFYGLSGRRS